MGPGGQVAAGARDCGARPPLWLFTDPRRMDVLDAVRGLPRGLCGVVFRHDGVPGRSALARAVARLCRERQLVMVMAGSWPAPAGVAAHRREGRGRRDGRSRRAAPGGTASAHGVAGLTRAAGAGCGCVFLSPAFSTSSHPGAPGLGPWRWAAMARRSGIPVLALGGIDGARARRLPRWCAGVGAIGALLA